MRGTHPPIADHAHHYFVLESAGSMASSSSHSGVSAVVEDSSSDSDLEYHADRKRAIFNSLQSADVSRYRLGDIIAVCFN